MCGRIIQSSRPDLLALKIVNGLEDRDNRVPTGTNFPPRYSGAPSQQHLGIRRHRQTGECSLDLLRWGLLSNWCKDPKALRPINAMAETVATKPYFREAYSRRRCIVPVDGFFEWMAVKGSKTARASASLACGRTGATRRPRNGSGRSRSLRSQPTRLSHEFTTECQRSSHLTSSTAGLARMRTLAT
jgi:putative SOS response-associated peptidase YedK